MDHGKGNECDRLWSKGNELDGQWSVRSKMRYDNRS